MAVLQSKSLRCVVAAAGLALFASAAAAGDPVKLAIVDGGIPVSLTGTPGNADNGKAAMLNRRGGNCLACHAISAFDDQPFHGEVGPTLDGAADRWSEAELRLLVANSKAVFEDTIMPAFHSTDNLNRVAEKFAGKTILSAQDVEDIVAFLLTLKE